MMARRANASCSPYRSGSSSYRRAPRFRSSESPNDSSQVRGNGGRNRASMLDRLVQSPLAGSSIGKAQTREHENAPYSMKIHSFVKGRS
jgi:hypothetical protein